MPKSSTANLILPNKIPANTEANKISLKEQVEKYERTIKKKITNQKPCH